MQKSGERLAFQRGLREYRSAAAHGGEGELMRGVVTLQVGLGLIALFLAVYLNSNRIMAPIETAQLVRAARAEAKSTAQEVEAAWSQRRESVRQVVSAGAGSPVLRTLGSDLNERRREPALLRALDGLVAMAGMKGQAILLDAEGQSVVPSIGADVLALSNAAKGALQGQTLVTVEAVSGQANLIAATAIVGDEKDADKVRGALVLGVPLKSTAISTLLPNALTTGGFAVDVGQKPIFGTLPTEVMKTLVSAPQDDEIEIAGAPHRSYRRVLAHDGKAEMNVVSAAALRPPGAASATDHFKMIVLLIGCAALLVALLGIGLAPSALFAGSSEVAAPSVSTSDLSPDLGLQSSNLGAAAQVRAYDDSTWDADEAVDSPAASASPSLKLVFGPKDGAGADAFNGVPSENASQDLSSLSELPMATPSGVAPPGAMPPDFAAEVPSAGLNAFAPPSSDGFPPTDISSVGSEEGLIAYQGSSDGLSVENEFAVALPPSPVAAAPVDSPMFDQQTLPAHPAPGSGLSGDLPSDGGEPPLLARSPADLIGGKFPGPTPVEDNFREPTPFDMLAEKAFSQPPAFEVQDEDAEMLMPKGPLSPELKAAQLAERQRRGEDLRPRSPPRGTSAAQDPNLPIPKDIPAPMAYEDQPGSAPRPMPEPDSDLDQTQAGSFPPGNAARDPWRNPSVPKMPAPQPPDEGIPLPSSDQGLADRAPEVAAPGGPAPYDEEHYRSVFEHFLASKQKLGESIDNLSYEGFRKKLRSSEEKLLGHYGCRAVRFQVLVKDQTVSLRPQLVR
ncbi:MAG: MXAN_5187 C-terminal domain-containing protein [Myxococcota bacterium]